MAELADDLFSDLISPGSASKPQAAASTPGLGALKPSTSLKEPAGATAAPAAANAGSSNGNAEDKPITQGEPVLPVAIQGVSKEELHAVVSGAVQAALDASFGKFVKSLRTVLEDLGKRVDAQSALCKDIQDALDSQALNVHSRFSSVDVALKEIDRGVQALRDRQELHEAQAMLAKLSHPLTTVEVAQNVGLPAPQQQHQTPQAAHQHQQLLFLQLLPQSSQLRLQLQLPHRPPNPPQSPLPPLPQHKPLLEHQHHLHQQLHCQDSHHTKHCHSRLYPPLLNPCQTHTTTLHLNNPSTTTPLRPPPRPRACHLLPHLTHTARLAAQPTHTLLLLHISLRAHIHLANHCLTPHPHCPALHPSADSRPCRSSP